MLIAASALALIFGWISANESLIWTSILASVASGIALALAYGRVRADGLAGSRPSSAAGSDVPLEVSERVSEPEPEPAPDDVVGVRHTKRFHKPSCRYAGAKNAEIMTKRDALEKGYSACGVCKP